jgi:hypothetical protein
MNNCPKCGAPHKRSDTDYYEFTCRSFLWRGTHNQEDRCKGRCEGKSEYKATIQPTLNQAIEALDVSLKYIEYQIERDKVNGRTPFLSDIEKIYKMKSAIAALKEVTK